MNESERDRDSAAAEETRRLREQLRSYAFWAVVVLVFIVILATTEIHR